MIEKVYRVTHVERRAYCQIYVTTPSTRKGKGQMECCEDIQDLVSEVLDIRSLLTLEEESDIHHQFRSCSWIPGHQVLWSGMLRERAQAWADERGMQTLTTAMGPLMDPRVPLCPWNRKSNKAWSKYIHGASAAFAWHIAKEDVVTVLCPPPPQRFHPSGRSFYQIIEEPILRSAIADGASLRIELVHPQVNGAEDMWYEMLPVDEVETWIESFGATTCYKCAWRMVKGDPPRKHTNVRPVPAKPTAKAAGRIGITTPARAECQSTPANIPKKKRKKKKQSQKSQPICGTSVTIASASSQKTQSKSMPLNTPSAVSQKKTIPTAKTAVPLKKTIPPENATKKTKNKAQKAAMKQKQEHIWSPAQKAATSKKTQNTIVTKASPKKTGKPRKGGSKPKTKAANSKGSKKGKAGTACTTTKTEQRLT